MMEPRFYQREALDATYRYWQDGGGNPLIDLATGTGKSLVIAKLCQELLEQWPHLCIGIIAGQKELLLQNTQELISLWPAAPVGIYSAGLGRRDIRKRILVCGIKSVWQKAELLGGFDLLIVDEAHQISRKSQSMYGRFIADCREIKPEMRIIGLSASPYRMDSGRLDDGEDKLFDEIVYTYGLADGVRDGFLCPIVPPAQQTELSVKGVSIRGGEFVDADIQRAAMEVVKAAAAEFVQIGKDRKQWLAYCPGVDHANALASEIRSYGYSCEAITGNTSNRDSLIKAAKERRGPRCLVFVSIGTTGLNIQHVDLIGMFTSTLSVSKFVQIGGRGSRLAEGKTDCIFADYGGNVRRHGPFDAISIGRRGDQDTGKAKVTDIRAKKCPTCEKLVAIQTRRCPHCEHEWPVSEMPRHDAMADTEAVPMQSLAKPKWLAVSDLDFTHHVGKGGKPDTVRAEYHCGLLTYREWKKPGWFWWKLRGRRPAPETVEEALNRVEELTWPREICVEPDGKYWRVIDHRMPPVEVEQDEEAA